MKTSKRWKNLNKNAQRRKLVENLEKCRKMDMKIRKMDF